MKKDIFIFRVDNAIDLITNSSSELFVIRADKQKEMVTELMREALDGLYGVNEYTLDNRVLKEKDEWDIEGYKEDLFNEFPEDKHHLISELFSSPNYYSFVIDRDSNNMSLIRQKLISIGFELVNSDY